MVAGQALQGWDAEETPARWTAAEATTPEGRQKLLNGTREWARARDEPLWEVVRWGHRSGSPFWSVSRRLVPVLEPEREGVWYSRYAWWNVYPLGWDDPDMGPDGALKQVQTPLVGELFWAVMDDIGARRIVLVAGKDWWPEVRGLLDLGELREGERPILAAGGAAGGKWSPRTIPGVPVSRGSATSSLSRRSLAPSPRSDRRRHDARDGQRRASI